MNIKSKNALPAIGVVLLSLACVSGAVADDDDVSPDLAEISLEQALSLALETVPGTALGIELEQEHDVLVWEVEVKDMNGGVTEVEIDAQTGQILEVEVDD